jgi:hypothetical protein
MRLWTIWIQADETTWLESAWDDETTAENRSGYEEAVDKAEETARVNKGAMRVIAIDVPDRSIFGAFDPAVAPAVVVPSEGS